MFPEAALAAAEGCEGIDQLDSHHVFRHLVAELPPETQAQWCAIGDRQGLAVQLVGKKRLRMVGVDEVDALVVGRAARSADARLPRLQIVGLAPLKPVGAMEDDDLRLRLYAGAVEHFGKRRAGPFADAAPALDAVMPG